MADYICEINNSDLYFTGEIDLESAHKFVILLRGLSEQLKNEQRQEMKSNGLDSNFKVKPSFNIYLTTAGGKVAQALKMYDAIQSLDANITIIAEGHVGSAGILLLHAGKHTKCTRHTTFMVHELKGNFNGTLTNNENTHLWHRTLMDYVLNIYKSKSLIDAGMLKQDTYLTAEGAKRIKLIDEIV